MKTSITKHWFVISLLIMALSVSSCKKDGADSDNELMDHIGLLDQYINFSSDGGQLSAKTKYSSWSLYAFLYYDSYDYVYIGEGIQIDTTTSSVAAVA